MEKRLIILSACLAFSLSAFSQKQKKQGNAPASWSERIAVAKQNAYEQMKKSSLPVASKVIKAKKAAEKFTADVTGLDEIVLYTWGTVDGTADDQAVWANARLIAADGSSVWLNDLKDTFKETGTGRLVFNANAKNVPVVMAGKTYERTIMANANTQIVVPLDKKYVRFEAEIGLENRSSAGTVIFRLQGITGKELSEDIIAGFPAESAQFLPFAGSDMKALVTTYNADIEKHIAQSVVDLLTDKAYFTTRIATVGQEKELDKQVIAYLNIAQDAMQVYELQESLSWLNVRAVEEAFNDMKRNKSFDQDTNQSRLSILKALVSKGFSGIYSNDATSIKEAKDALQLKHDILLANPELDMDKLIVGRYHIGTNARQINPRSLGTQNNNWSNQTSAARGGFDAEIVELSNLRGDIQSRTIFKPDNGSSVPDLKLHWDADRIMFSMVDTDKRWQVFEVGIDGKGLKKLVESPEKDLEFFDATWLPSGKIMAISN